MDEQAATTGRAVIKYRVHWHVVLTHFPISVFAVSSGFMVLHLVTGKSCYEISASYCLYGGALIMLPTSLTGWAAWKDRFRGMRGKLFIYKIRISIAMTALSLLLLFVRIRFTGGLHSVWLYAYSFGILLLLAGALAEGFYGGRLNHR